MSEQKGPPSDPHLEAMGLKRWRHRTATESPDELVDEPAAQSKPTPDNGSDGRTLTLEPEKVERLKWRRLRQNVAECTRCELHRTRKNTVFGAGDENADLMLIGEAPGADEDAKGEPFVGRAGLLLNNMLGAIGIQREEVFIANILKCRPPRNENPTAEEASECRSHLQGQIDMIQPRVILALGGIATQNLLGIEKPIGQLRGQAYPFQDSDIRVIPTYHPAYLLRSPRKKADAFEDLLLMLRVLEQGDNAQNETLPL